MFQFFFFSIQLSALFFNPFSALSTRISGQVDHYQPVLHAYRLRESQNGQWELKVKDYIVKVALPDCWIGRLLCCRMVNESQLVHLQKAKRGQKEWVNQLLAPNIPHSHSALSQGTKTTNSCPRIWPGKQPSPDRPTDWPTDQPDHQEAIPATETTCGCICG